MTVEMTIEQATIFEDIIYVLDNRTRIVEEIINSDNKVRAFLVGEFKKIKNHQQFKEIISQRAENLICVQTIGYPKEFSVDGPKMFVFQMKG